MPAPYPRPDPRPAAIDFPADLPAVDPARHVLIAGPTASGKSALALAIARAQGGVVVNADALQVWSCWRVLTARPSPRDEAAAPHALYGHVDPGRGYSVEARRIGSSGKLGPLRTLARNGPDTAWPDVAMDLHGVAVVVWPAGEHDVYVRRLRPGGSLGA